MHAACPAHLVLLDLTALIIHDEVYLRIRYYYCDKMWEDEISGACSVLERDEKCIDNFGSKSEGRRSLGRLGIGGKIILEWVLGR